MSGFNKVVGSYEEAMAGLIDGMTIIAGGFGLCGIPENLIKEIKRMGSKNLTLISNNCGTTEHGSDRSGCGGPPRDRRPRLVARNALLLGSTEACCGSDTSQSDSRSPKAESQRPSSPPGGIATPRCRICL